MESPSAGTHQPKRIKAKRIRRTTDPQSIRRCIYSFPLFLLCLPLTVISAFVLSCSENTFTKRSLFSRLFIFHRAINMFITLFLERYKQQDCPFTNDRLWIQNRNICYCGTIYMSEKSCFFRSFNFEQHTNYIIDHWTSE